jgi:hypothetical protein
MYVYVFVSKNNHYIRKKLRNKFCEDNGSAFVLS